MLPTGELYGMSIIPQKICLKKDPVILKSVLLKPGLANTQGYRIQYSSTQTFTVLIGNLIHYNVKHYCFMETDIYAVECGNQWKQPQREQTEYLLRAAMGHSLQRGTRVCHVTCVWQRLKGRCGVESCVVKQGKVSGILWLEEIVAMGKLEAG